jgi:nitrite reductase (NADH) small subunit
MTLIDATRPVSLSASTNRVASGLEWVRVCPLDVLEPGWAEAALVGGQQIALVFLGRGDRDEVRLHAVSHHDPHSGAPVMARGIVGSRHVDGEGHRPTITSPLLKQVYDLATGACYSDAALSLPTFRSRVVDGMVEVEVAR